MWYFLTGFVLACFTIAWALAFYLPEPSRLRVSGDPGYNVHRETYTPSLMGPFLLGLAVAALVALLLWPAALLIGGAYLGLARIKKKLDAKKAA